QERGIYNNYR
ncbi:hypothetical protein D039_1239B, partial [Vibrio parahaemolyticus EKP-028]